MMNIGDRILARRQELGLSVEEVAKALGKNRATVYRYESHDIEKMPLSVLEPLSKILQTTPAYLMGWNEKEGLTIHKDDKPVTAPLVNQIIEKLNGLSPALKKVALAQLDSLTRLQDKPNK